MKKLTERGLEEVDEVIDIEMKSQIKDPPQTPHPLPIPVNQNYPSNEDTLKFKIKKITFIFLIIFGILALVLIASNLIWFNYTLQKKNFNSSIITNVDAPQVPVDVQNDYTHEIYNNITIEVNIPNDIIIRLKNETS